MEESIETYSEKIWAAVNEYWDAFLFNLPRILFALFLFLIILFLAVKISRLIGRRLLARAHDKLFSDFITSLIKYVLIITGVMICFQVLGLSGIAGGLLAGAGVSALVFGFAFKDIGENFLAGIILAFNRPFQMDDTIKVLDFMGRVQALNFRTTHIKTFDEKDVFIPNSTIVKEVLTNFTRDGKLRLEFVIGIAYENDAPEAMNLIVKTIGTCQEVLDSPEPFAIVDEFATNTVNIRAFFWTSTEDYRRGVLLMKSNVMAIAKQALADHGFSMPANVVDLKLYDFQKQLPIQLRENRDGSSHSHSPAGNR